MKKITEYDPIKLKLHLAEIQHFVRYNVICSASELGNGYNQLTQQNAQKDQLSVLSPVNVAIIIPRPSVQLSFLLTLFLVKDN